MSSAMRVGEKWVYDPFAWYMPSLEENFVDSIVEAELLHVEVVEMFGEKGVNDEES